MRIDIALLVNALGFVALCAPVQYYYSTMICAWLKLSRIVCVYVCVNIVIIHSLTKFSSK